jgi:3-dehydroquinate synthase
MILGEYKMPDLITVHRDEKPIYDIVIENSFAKLADSFAKLGVRDRKLCIVTDSHVGKIYADEVKACLEKTGNQVFVYTFAAGEESKNIDTVCDVYEFLIQNHFDRKDMLVALGGGVVGDLTGFTAASYLRGVDFIQIPTSLLAQVDSSIGGKTGVDFRAYKNMVGAFHMPKLVYMNTSTLKTLDDRQFNSGFGEILKHGLIKDYDYFKWLGENRDSINAREDEALSRMVSVSCNIKRKVVELDPTEKGDRALLNFGHTLGHAIEKLMNFTLYHGECVVLGMIAALNICVAKGSVSKDEYDSIIDVFKSYDFPLTVSGITIADVVKTSKSDKKMDAGKIKFILLKELGNAYIDRNVSDEELAESLEGIVI